MQYVSPITTPQKLVFSKPVEYSTGEVLKFTSYGVNFEVTPTAITELNHFIFVTFTLASEVASYFESGTEYKVMFGNVFDYVVGNISPDEVIEYSKEDVVVYGE